MSNEWRDLKTLQDIAAAQAAGDEIEYFLGGRWKAWQGVTWNVCRQFRARPRQKTEKIKMLCWFINGHLNWLQEGNHAAGPDWKRVPSEDKEIEIEVEDD